MRELKIVIPAIIDYCRYSNSNLGTNRHYFFWTPESKKINLVTKPVFSNDGMITLLFINFFALKTLSSNVTRKVRMGLTFCTN